MIQVEQTEDTDPMTFRVRITEHGGTTQHEVTLSRQSWRQLARGKASPIQLVEAAFAFLLEREPKEAILRRFDLDEIGHYFPEFAQRIHAYLPASKA